MIKNMRKLLRTLKCDLAVLIIICEAVYYSEKHLPFPSLNHYKEVT